ncbi:MAG: polysaccharide biosynthesis tyrosine autokinase [Candidatus Aenigmarchaeota archaeon]|nr:polysaccharide biosynthesis tyrosine autokinase [Candidatus Aenigmarchaeota archaeon]
MINFYLPKEIADQFDKLTHYIFTNSSKKIRTLSIVSSTQGEGNSTVAINFALNLAVNHKARILLVDMNLRKPILHQVFRVGKEKGLTDLLLKKIDFHMVLKKTAVPNLFLITSGENILNPDQLFESMKIEEVLKRQAKQFDYIILDCPPVNSYPEATLLASQSDGVILVVQAGKTRHQVVHSAQTKLINAKVNILGVVLNRRKYYIPRWIYNKL